MNFLNGSSVCRLKRILICSYVSLTICRALYFHVTARSSVPKRDTHVWLGNGGGAGVYRHRSLPGARGDVSPPPLRAARGVITRPGSKIGADDVRSGRRCCYRREPSWDRSDHHPVTADGPARWVHRAGELGLPCTPVRRRVTVPVTQNHASASAARCGGSTARPGARSAVRWHRDLVPDV